MNKRYWCRSTTGKKSIWDIENDYPTSHQEAWYLLIEDDQYPRVLLTQVLDDKVEYGYERTNFVFRKERA